MVDHIFSNDSAKIAIESSKKDQQDEIRRDEHIMKILKAANKRGGSGNLNNTYK